MSQSPGYLGVEILNAARRWAAARAVLRRTLDSKSATPEARLRAQTAYKSAADELERFVLKLERLLASVGASVPKGRRPETPFPWSQLFGVLGAGASALGEALSNKPATPSAGPQPPAQKSVRAEVIDVKDET